MEVEMKQAHEGQQMPYMQGFGCRVDTEIHGLIVRNSIS